MRPAAVLPALALLLLGACTVTDARSDRDSPLAERWAREQRVELDLTSPPDREQAGIADGRRSLPLERRPPDHLDVRLDLPGGERLELSAVSMFLAADGPEGPPVALSVATLQPPDEGVAALQEVVERFGFDPARLDAFLQDAAAAADGDVSRSLGRVELDYLRFEVDVRRLQADDALQLTYAFRWDA